MKILTPEEMRAADAAAFELLAIPSRAIMESAGRHAADFLVSEYAERLELGILVLAGAGNNGGDGFVLARAVLALGIPITVYSLKDVSELAGDTKANAEAFLALDGTIACLDSSPDVLDSLVTAVGSCGVLVDALFGTGLSSPLREDAAALIAGIDAAAESAGVPILSIDIPSGVNAGTGELCGAAIRAHATVSLQCLKVGHVLFPGASHAGQTVCLDIGVPESLEQISSVRRDLLVESDMAALVQQSARVAETSHKGTRGHLLIVGGSAGHYGAPKLSGLAGLRCGAGLVSLCLPESAAKAIGPDCLEMMCTSLPDDGEGDFAEAGVRGIEAMTERKSSLVIGPGLGQGGGAAAVLSELLQQAKDLCLPTVLDADALNLLAREESLRSLLGPHILLTPHPGEMARLADCSVAEVESARLDIAKKLAADLNCYLVLKGARSVIASPHGELWVNPAAVPTLATGGSGDVLAGIAGALLARGVSVEDTAKIAVFVHGAAGELCFELNSGETGTIASDIARAASMVLNALSQMPLISYGFLRPALPQAMQHLPEFLSPEGA